MQNLCIYLPALLSSILSGKIEKGPGKPKRCSQSGIATRLKKLVPQQAVRIMKLTAIILLAACLQVQATAYGQKITLALKDAPVEKLFDEIRQQAGYEFLYINKVVQNAKPVTIKVKNATVDEVLKLCFKEQPFDFEIKEKTIVITPKKNNYTSTEVQDEGKKTIDIKGLVVNENGEPAEGVTVTVKGTSISTMTAANGEFILRTIEQNATLVFTSVNMETFEVKVNGRLNLDVTLQTKITSMREVIVNKGYYTEKRMFATGNVSTVKSSDIAKQPVNNPLLALVARVPGLQVQQATGFANSAVTVSIQGTNSLAAGLEPLYVIDGVPYGNLLIPGSSRGGILGSSGNNTVGNPLSFLNPNDIEVIDVLKDADAISIYGSRGANGVILITTKKGRAGKTKVGMNMRTGWGQVVSKVQLMNTEQYMAMRQEGYKNDGVSVPNNATAPSNNNYDLTVWDQNRYTDWQKVLIGGTARYTDAQLSLSGGNANTQFLISPGYHTETTIFPGDFSDRKGSLQFNMSHADNKQRFKAQFSGTYVVDDNQLPQTDLTFYALGLAPNAPKLYNEDGTLNWAPIASGSGTVSTWINPLAYLNDHYNTKANNLISNVLLSYKLLSGLTVSGSFGYSNLQRNELATSTFAAIRPERRATSTRSAAYGNGKASNWIIEPQASYALGLGKGKLEVLVGSTFQESNMNYQLLLGEGYNSDLLLNDIKSASSITVINNMRSTFKYNALYGRLNYNWANKYIANFTARRDGSSRFGSENLFANFYSVAGAWIFSNEGFLANNSLLSFGKLRASYGTSGNDQIGEYGFMNLYNSVSQDVPYQGIPVMQPDRHTNPYLQWEMTKKLNFGLDLGLLKDRIQLNVNYYLNRSSNLLVQTALSSNTGFNSVQSNFEGVVQNRGWELALNTINVRYKDFSWTSSFNLTIPVDNGVLKSFPNLSQSVNANKYAIGKSILDTKRYHSLGVDAATGKYIFQDANGNTTLSPGNNDLTEFINLSQRLYGGMQNIIQYKNFQLDFTLQYVKRNAMLPLDINNFPGYFNGAGNVGNQPVIVLDRWQKAGDAAMFQKFTGTRPFDMFFQQSYFTSSDGVVVKANYLKLTNASFSWNLPAKWRKAARLQNTSLFVQGQNLFTIDKYKSLDASTGSFRTLPPIRVVTIGCNISL